MSNAKQPTKQAKSATPSTRAKRTTLSDDDQLAMALAAEGITPDYSQPTNNTPVSPSAPQPDQQSNADNRSLREQMEQLEEAVERYQQAARVAEQIDQRLREIKNKVTIITEDTATS